MSTAPLAVAAVRAQLEAGRVVVESAALSGAALRWLRVAAAEGRIRAGWSVGLFGTRRAWCLEPEAHPLMPMPGRQSFWPDDLRLPEILAERGLADGSVAGRRTLS